MRITSGTLKGQTLLAPKNAETRPTSDANREALFTILTHALGHELGYVCDFFSGSGALSFEAISHGATGTVLFENQSQALQCIEKNRANLVAKRALAADFPLSVIKSAKVHEWGKLLVKNLPAKAQIHTFFCDPPYNRGFIPKVFKALEEHPQIIHPEAIFVAEIEKNEELLPPPVWKMVKERSRGMTRLLFYRRS